MTFTDRIINRFAWTLSVGGSLTLAIIVSVIQITAYWQ